VKSLIEKKEILEIHEGYDPKDITIAVLGSHSALQILKGAKEMGFNTLAVCKNGREQVYKRFKVADEILSVKNYMEFTSEEVLKTLREKNSIIIPHGSLVAYVGVKNLEEKVRVPFFGNRGILRWESDRKMERKWLETAKIKLPKEFKDPSEIDRLCLIKFPGARGGRDYFLSRSPKAFKKKTDKLLKDQKITKSELDEVTIQEYISGVNMYVSYFFSPLNEEVELFGMDKRYESNIDGLTRISAIDQIELYGDARFVPSYVVAGNVPVVVRESLLDKIFRMGDSVVKVSKEICPPGMVGAFCLEAMVTNNLDLIVFEISARIVAGTNPYIQGSPYSYLMYGDNMSMGKRIALEIKNAVESDQLDKLIT
jgi:5-formaminoimidazole-4-carboxamide-1-(beta)-D-ribofuranosyl 5'-monophosphate synthetase